MRFLAPAFFVFLILLLYHNVESLQFSNYQWLPEDNIAYQNKRYLDEEFNQGESLTLVVRLAQSYFRKEVTAELAATVDRLRRIDKVKKVTTPLHASAVFVDSEGALHNVSFQKALEKQLISWQQYPERLRETPYWGRIISSETRTFIINMTLDTKADESNTQLRKNVFAAVEDILADTRLFNDVGFAGEAELTHRIDLYSQQDLARLLPLGAGALLLMLALSYRRVDIVVIIATIAAVALLLTFILNQFLGYSFSVISASLPLLIMVIVVADAIHIMRRWQINQHKPKPVWQCAKDTWRPCLMTTLTSAAGFAVFYFSELVPLSEFGVVAFIAISSAYVVIMGGSMLLLHAFQPAVKVPRNSSTLLPLPVRFASRVSIRYWRLCSWSSALILVGAAMIAPLATSESNFLNVFFDQDSATVKSFDRIDSDLTGSGGVDVIYRSGESGTFKKIAPFTVVEEQIQKGRKLVYVSGAGGLSDPVAMVHRKLSGQKQKLPDTDSELAQEILFLEFSRSDKESDVLSEYVDFDYTNSRVHFYTPNLKSSEAEELIAALVPVLRDQSLRFIITGINVYFKKLSDYVLETQWISMLLMGAFVWLLFVFLFGRHRGSAGMISCALPISVVLAGQILLRIPFDFATVLVASISIGLCIDDAIHYLYHYRMQRRDRSPFRSIMAVNRDLWQPIVVTSSSLLCGFSVLLLSDLIVVQRFALGTAVAIALSVLSVFVVLPAALLVCERLEKRI